MVRGNSIFLIVFAAEEEEESSIEAAEVIALVKSFDTSSQFCCDEGFGAQL